MTPQTENNICLIKSDKPRVVVIGGGFAGVHFIKAMSKVQQEFTGRSIKRQNAFSSGSFI